MKNLYLLLAAAIFYAPTINAEEAISLFGSKPIQLEVTKEGIKKQTEPGYVCDLTASLGGAKYSEWGATEEDARSMVHDKCSRNSGALICKKEKATCKQEK